MTTDYHHASPITRTERGVQLIEEMRDHPHRFEVLRLASEQMEDMNSTTYQPELTTHGS
jgi:hypothetical protein